MTTDAGGPGGGMAARLREKLEAAFAPIALRIEDQSERHRGHSGWREGGETHFHIFMTTTRFAGLSRLERHRLVNACLSDELAGPVHALSLDLAAPDERAGDKTP